MRIVSSGRPDEGQILFEASIPSDVSLKREFAHMLVTNACSLRLVPADAIDKYFACFEDAIENAIVHGNLEDTEKDVVVRLCYGKGLWSLHVRDNGPGFDLADSRGEDAWSDRGRGLAIFDGSMDDASYFNEVSTLVLSKEFEFVLPAEDDSVESDERCSIKISIQDLSTTIARLEISRAIDSEFERIIGSICAYVVASPTKILVLDMREVSYLNSHGLALLVQLAKRCLQSSVQLRLASLNDELTRLFELTHLKQVFDVYDQTHEAVLVDS